MSHVGHTQLHLNIYIEGGREGGRKEGGFKEGFKEISLGFLPDLSLCV